MGQYASGLPGLRCSSVIPSCLQQLVSPTPITLPLLHCHEFVTYFNHKMDCYTIRIESRYVVCCKLHSKLILNPSIKEVVGSYERESLHHDISRFLYKTSDNNYQLIRAAASSNLSPCLHSVLAEGVPTCIDFLSSDPNHMMAAYSSGNAFVFDLTTGQQVHQLESMPAGKSLHRITKHIKACTISKTAWFQ